jgi:hypothetical protein
VSVSALSLLCRQDVSHQSVDDGRQQNAADVVSMAHEVANRKCTLQAVAQHVPVRPLELDSVHGSMTPSPIRTREGVNIDRATSREDQDGYLSTEDTSGEGEDAKDLCVDLPRVLFEMDMDLGDGRCLPIQVREDTDVYSLVSNMAACHGLSPSEEQQIARYLCRMCKRVSQQVALGSGEKR